MMRNIANRDHLRHQKIVYQLSSHDQPGKRSVK